MNIVIIGAGDIGFAIAELLSTEDHDVILVDRKRSALERADQYLDVATRLGSGSDWQLLEELSDPRPEMLVALTDDDETNLVCCTIAKELGYRTTIARVRNAIYLNRTRIDFGRVFSVDHFVSPDLLVAQDIYKYVISLASMTMEMFAYRAVQMRTLIIPQKWKHGDKSLAELTLPEGVMVGLIRREVESKRRHSTGSHEELIFPHGMDHLLPGDEVTFLGQTESMQEVHSYFGIPQPQIKAATIVGGSLMGSNLAKIMQERDIDVRLIDRDYDRCCELAEELPRCSILHHDGTDLKFLLSEKIGKDEILIGCTHRDETNILVAMLGRKAGCERVIASISDTAYTPLLKDLGITHAVSARTSTANSILSIARAKSVISTYSMYDNRVKIIEMKVSLDSRVVGIPLSELGPYLPKDFLIAVIQNRGRVVVAKGETTLSPGDTVIAITTPARASELQKIF